MRNQFEPYPKDEKTQKKPEYTESYDKRSCVEAGDYHGSGKAQPIGTKTQSASYAIPMGVKRSKV